MWKSLTDEQLKWFVVVVDMFSQLHKLLVICMSWYETRLILDHILSLKLFSSIYFNLENLREMNIPSMLRVHSNSLNISLFRSDLFINWTATSNHIFVLDVMPLGTLMLDFLDFRIIFSTCILWFCSISLWHPLAHGVTSILQLICFRKFLSKPSHWLYFDMCNLQYMLGIMNTWLDSNLLHA